MSHGLFLLNLVSRKFCLAGLAGLLFFTCCSSKDKRQEEAVPEEQVVAAGIEILRNGTPVERDSVTRSFYNIRNARLLVAHLNDPDSNVQIGVVSALGYIKDKSTVGPLNELLLSADDYLLRETVITVLGEIRDTSSVSLLIGLLEDKTTNRDLRLSLPITLAAFAETPAAGRVEETFAKMLEQESDDLEICSFVAMGIQEIINPDNFRNFRKYLPALREMAEKRKEQSGEDLLWSNFQNTIEKLQTYEPPAS
ncbi:MAG: HEAT repeat domain-containing protein [Candidatus Glassbacteria bacterium]|nr:HEAT repeat domain-containing protein [Candidatus Glassbacteria bacterium]